MRDIYERMRIIAFKRELIYYHKQLVPTYRLLVFEELMFNTQMEVINQYMSGLELETWRKFIFLNQTATIILPFHKQC